MRRGGHPGSGRWSMISAAIVLLVLATGASADQRKAKGGKAKKKPRDVHVHGERVSLDITVLAPSWVVTGMPFEVEVKVRNSGDKKFPSVIGGVGGTAGVKTYGKKAQNQKLGELGPGKSVVFKEKLEATSAGMKRVTASVRDKNGWAAAGVVMPVALK